MTRPLFEELFRTSEPRRDKFLSRLFGLFSEDVVRSWATHPQALYEDLGRPSLFLDAKYRHTLDFTLRNRETRRTYIAELKCELEFEGYRYLRLESAAQLAHHTGAAFRAFSEFARDPTVFAVRIGGQAMTADGAVLVWGATTPEGRKAAISECGFADVLSVEEMLDDLSAWNSASWLTRVSELRAWSAVLFDFLVRQPGPRRAGT